MVCRPRKRCRSHRHKAATHTVPSLAVHRHLLVGNASSRGRLGKTYLKFHLLHRHLALRANVFGPTVGFRPRCARTLSQPVAKVVLRRLRGRLLPGISSSATAYCAILKHLSITVGPISSWDATSPTSRAGIPQPPNSFLAIYQPPLTTSHGS